MEPPSTFFVRLRKVLPFLQPVRRIFPVLGVLLCFVVGPWLPAAERALAPEYFVRSWQMDDGLASNTIHRVLQDKNHFLWLATMEGLARFDGRNFKSYPSPLVGSVSARNIRSLAAENDTTLLIIPASGGLVRLTNGEFSYHPANALLSGKNIQSLYVDSGGAVWLGTTQAMILRWKAGEMTTFDLFAGKAGGGSNAHFAEENGDLWISCGDYIGNFHNGQLTRYNDNRLVLGSAILASSHTGGPWISKGSQLGKIENNQLVILSDDLPWAATGGRVETLFEDNTGALWIGTRAHGLYRWFEHSFAEIKTSQSQITSVFEDREGSIWVGTIGGGINRIRPNEFRLYNTATGVPREVSGGVCADPQGNIWLANRSGGVVQIRDHTVSPLPLKGPGRPLQAYAICADDQGNLWVSDDRLYRVSPDRPGQIEVAGPDLRDVHALYKAPNGDIWIGGNDHLLGHFPRAAVDQFTLEKGFPGKTVRCITEDAAGAVWVGCEEGELYKVSDGKISSFGLPEGLPSSASLRSLYADPQGALWIGSSGGGLILWSGGKFTQIASAEGLPDNTILEIVEDDHGRIWFGSQRGIFHLPKRELLDFAAGKIMRVSATSFGPNEGLPRLSCYGTCQPMSWKERNGDLWFVTQQGVLTIPSRKPQANPTAPDVYIDEIRVNDQELPLDSAKLIIPPGCKKIEFRVSAPSYAVPEKVHLRYRLEGVDAGWIETANRAAVYAALPAGSYRLRLVASNSDGVWNKKETTLDFTVRPALSQAVWFRFLFVLLVSSSLILVARYSTKRQLKVALRLLASERLLEKERARIARDLHDDLGSSLTQVSLMLEEMNGSQLSADDLKQQSIAIAVRVRDLAHDLHSVVWTVDPKNDSLSDLVDFLSRFFLQSFRPTAIRTRLEVEDPIPSTPLSPEARHHVFLVVKEAVNNAIKHSRATEVKLSLRCVEGVFNIIFADNGVGFTPAPPGESKRHGLQNMQSRVRELSGEFKLTSIPGQETVIHLSIPLVGNSIPLLRPPLPSCPSESPS